MISVTKTMILKWVDNAPISYVELACVAADTKPTDGIATGSICVEVDTGNVFMYDEESSAWTEQFCLQD